MKRRRFCGSLAILPAAAALLAIAQPARMFRVAWVSTELKNSTSPTLEAFRSGMRALGYAEGGNVTIDTWWGEGSNERLDDLAGDIIRSRADVILAQGGYALDSMIRAGVKTPLVFSVSADPVEAKYVESFARPGGNMTGISLFTLALVGKRLELLKETLPGIKQVALSPILNIPVSRGSWRLRSGRRRSLESGFAIYRCTAKPSWTPR
ncbi:MAG TPA: ABC transporter substrate binding protein [Casimicrobiaceae bacterium]|jgi:putative ABC transport system substrate-binding protein